MKYILLNKKLFICLLYLTTIMQTTLIAAKKPYHNKVVLQFVDFDIFTTANVNCINFNKAFNDEIQTRTLTNSQKIKELKAHINKLKIDKEAKSVDVRMKIKIYTDHNVEVICLDRFNILKGGLLYEMDKSFFQHIENLKIPCCP